MKVGMLWYDDDNKRTLEDKVHRAADYYRQKYGRRPNLCLINPKALAAASDGGVGTGTIELRTAHNMLLNHFWVGVGEKEV